MLVTAIGLYLAFSWKSLEAFSTTATCYKLHTRCSSRYTWMAELGGLREVVKYKSTNQEWEAMGTGVKETKTGKQSQFG